MKQFNRQADRAPTRRKWCFTGPLKSVANGAGWLVVGIVVGVIAVDAAHANHAQADDVEVELRQIRQLVQGRRNDEALEQLDALARRDDLTEEQRGTVLLERGKTLIAVARLEQDAAARQRRLADAVAALRKFIKHHDTHPRVRGGLMQMASALVEQARRGVEEADEIVAAGGDDEQAVKQAKQRADKLRADARPLYVEAVDSFTRIVESTKRALAALPRVIPRNAPAQAERNALRSDYLQARLLVAAAQEEMSRTYAAGTPAADKLLKMAAERYDKIYNDYRSRVAGLYARMYTARCYVKLNDPKRAIPLLRELLEQPDEPRVFVSLKRKAVLILTDALAHKSVAKPVEAIEQASAILKLVGEQDEQHAEVRAIRVRLATAHLDYADTLKAGDPVRDVHRREAMQLATQLLAKPGPHRDEARALIRRSGKEIPEPSGFDDARQRGQATLKELGLQSQRASELETRIAAEEDEAVRARLKKDLTATNAKVEELTDRAYLLMRAALKRVDDTVSQRDRNQVTYFFCYLAYKCEDYDQVIARGEQLMQGEAADPIASQTAKIVLASTLKAYQAAPQPQRAQRLPKLIKTAEFVIDKWPRQSVAADALKTLIPIMDALGKQQEADGYRERLQKLMNR